MPENEESESVLFARQYPESAARVVVKAYLGLGDTLNAWQVLVAAVGGEQAKVLLAEADSNVAPEILAKVTSGRIYVTCTYENGDTTSTWINATPEEARAYYVGQTFNLGIVDDDLQRCVSIEVHP